MTSPLDEISYKLGEISAGLAILANKATKQEQISNDLAVSMGEIKTRMKPLTDDLAWMKPQVAHYKSFRKNAAWLGSIIVAVFGAVGGVASDWLFKKFVG